jgi:hypothetical protein
VKKPLYQRGADLFVFLLLGYSLFGALLGATSNAISLITAPITYYLSPILLILWIFAEIFLRTRRLRWVLTGNQEVIIRGLGLRYRMAIVGAIMLLWVPRLFDVSASERATGGVEELHRGSQVTEGFNSKVFFARLHVVVEIQYPGPLAYTYNNAFIAPVGLAMALEVVNTRPTMTNIYAYDVDIDANGQWNRVFSLPLLDPLSLFWVNHGDFHNCSRLDFRDNGFDVLARGKNLQAGESVRGWIFLEWPQPMRKSMPEFSKVRLRIESVQGERDTLILPSPTPWQAGESLLGGGEWQVASPNEKTDLSHLGILPYAEAIRGAKKATDKY